MNTTTSTKRLLAHGLAGIAAALLVFTAFAPRASAIDVYWGGGTGAITDNNWFSDPGLTTPVTRVNADAIWLASGTLSVPSLATTGSAYIGIAAGDDATIIVSSTWTSGVLSIGNGLGSSGGLSILTGGTVRATTLYVGGSGAGYLYVAEGGVIQNTANAMLGRLAGGSGTAVIDGSWVAGTYIQLGYIANSQGNLLTIGQTGTVKTTSYMLVGGTTNTSGSVNVNGQLDVGTYLLIGHGAGSSGTVNVAGLLGVTGSLSVGNNGTGYLEVTSSGTVSNVGTSYVGYAASAVGTANVAGLLKATGNFAVGQSGSGYLNIAPTGTVSIAGTSFIANLAGSSGTASVSGLFDASGGLYVGGSGTGVLTIAEGGLVSSTTNIRIANALGSSGIVKVSGSLTTGAVLYVGWSGNALLDIAETGVVKAATYLHIGKDGTGVHSGTAKVAGLLDIGTSFHVGYTGTGFIDILQSGTALAGTYVAIGSASNGKGIATVAGYLKAGSYLNVGHEGTNDIGYLDIASTGTVKATTYSYLGKDATTSGSVKVAGLFDIGTNLLVGNSGTGVLTLESGGSVIVGGTTTIASAAASKGTLVLNGGVLETAQLAQGAGAASFVFNGGTLRAAADTADFLNMATLDLGAGTLNLDTQGFTVTATNAFTATAGGAVDKRGAGMLVLDGNNAAYTGAINIREGSLGGSATGVLGGDLNILSGATLDVRAAPLTTTGNVTFADGAIWQYSLTGTHVLNVAGALNFAGGGTVLLDRDGMDIPSIPGAYTLANYGSVTGAANLSTWSLTGMDFALTGSLTTDASPGSLILEIGSANTDILYWQGGAGAWDDASTTWKRSGTAAPWNFGALGIFNVGSGAVDITGLQTASGLQFDTAGYVLGGTGTLASGGTMNINLTTASAAATINAALDAAALRKVGPGALTLGGVATIGGPVVVDSGSLAIASTGNVSASDVQISSTTATPATVTVAGLLSNSGTLFIGDFGSGALEVAATGTVSAATAEIGSQVGSSGTARVAGLLGVMGSFAVGNNGVGYLEVTSSGSVSNVSTTYIGQAAGSTGTATVAGLLHTTGNLAVGQAGVGYLEIAPTGTVQVGGNSYIGNAAGGSGIASVAGSLTGDTLSIGSALSGSGALSVLTGGSVNATTFYVGNYGTGYLHIAEGGVLSNSANAMLGRNTGGSGTAVIDGSWTAGTYIQMGYIADSTDNVIIIGQTGTVKTTSYFRVGSAAGSSGTLTVRGLLDVGTNLTMGTSGSGTLDLQSTGSITVGGATYLGNEAGGYGEATIGGYLSTSVIHLGYTGTGVLDLISGGTIISGTVNIGLAAAGNGTLVLNGGVLETKQIVQGAGTAAFVFNGGTLRAGVASSDFLSMASLDLGSGTLTLDTQAFAITATNAFAGTGAAVLDKTGAGTLTLTADSSGYAGALNIRSGALAGGAGAKIGGQVNIHSGATLDMRDGPLAVTGNISLADGAIWQYSLAGEHALDVSGTLAFEGAGTFLLDRGGIAIPDLIGSYTLANYTGGISGTANLASWVVSGMDFTLSSTLIATVAPGTLTLEIGSADVDFLYWQGGNGVWDAASTTWLRSGAPVVWTDGAFAVFNAGSGTVDVTDAQIITGMQFDTAGYILEGAGSLASSTLLIHTTAPTADATINVPITADAMHKAGEGSVTLGGPSSFTGEAFIDGGALAIAATGNLSAAGVQISSTTGDAASVAVAGLLSNTGTLFIGSTGSGALDIEATGTVNSASTIIASEADSIGSATVAGLLNTTGALTAGASGAGALDIAATGTATGASAIIASDAGSTGSANIAGLLNVTGPLTVGNAGAGDLAVASTGTVNATTASIGAQAGSTGAAIVEGLFKTTGGISVGDAGDGSLDIASTGTATAGAITHIGAAVGSSGTVRVAGLLGVTGSFSIGNNGAGQLEVTSSGTVSNVGTTYLGYAAGSTGTATVAGLLSTTGNLAVGQNGGGYLEIASAGTGTIGGTAYIANAAGSSGTLSVAGLFGAGSNLAVGNYGSGALIIAPTGTVTNATTAIGWQVNSAGYADVAGVWNLRNNLNVGNAAGAVGELKIAATGTVTVGTYFIVGHVPDATGTATIAGSLVVSNSIVVGNSGGVGYIEVAPTGTITSGNITLGSGTGAQGIANVAGFWNAAGGNSWIGDSGAGTLVIGQTGTVFLGGVDNYVLIGGNASSSGDVTVAGYLDTGTRSYVNPSSGGGALIVGNGVLTITPTGTVTTSGTGQDTFAFAVSRSGATSSVFNLAGLLETRAGGALIGTRGVATVNIASTGTFLVDGEYRQTAQAALSIAVDPARTDAYITAASARLSGTLTLAGSGLDYTPVARSSELSDAGVLVLTATSGTIAGSFSAITGMGGVAPDYLMPGSFIETDESTGFANYRAAYRLAWNGPDSAHGTFTIAGGETFEVDTPLADRIGEAAPGWDKKSLTKSGAGTLILSAQNTFTGTLAINSGTIRLGGPELHRFGSLANDGVLDFGTPATLPVTPPGIMAAPPSGITYRTVEVGSLSGNGIFQMTVNPGTGESDRLIVLGKATGSHHINLTASADATAPDGGSAPTLAKINGTNGATFTGGLDFDGANYAIVPASGGNIILATNGEAGINDAIRGVPGAQSLMWFASQDNLARRIGELRGVDTDRSSLWLRVRAEESRIRTGANPRPFTMHLYGAEIGVDKTFHRFASSRVVTGIYGGYGRATQDFRLREGIGSADGKSSQLSLGLYAAWLHNAGWYSNLTLAGARHRNEFGSADQSGNRTRGNYDDHALGASLEAGKRIALDRVIGKGWFAEPSAQVSVLRLMRKNYATTGANLLEVRGDGANVIRTRGVLRAGRAWQAKSGQIEVLARAGASNEASKDGEIRMSTGSWRPNIDGTRAEAGLGLIWRRTLADQLYFDYEFATGDSYQKPWSVSLGYRHAF